jgi:3-oxoacyl-[acyl-carrier-protein] synthase II
MVSGPDVVITGLGVVSPIGIGGKAYWDSLHQQRSGVTLLPEMAATDLPVRIGGAIVDFEPKQFVKPRKALKVMSREIQTGFSSAVLAMDQAGIEPGRVPPERMGVVFGAEMLYCEPQDMLAVYRRCMDEGRFRFERWGAAAMSEMYPLWMLMYLPNMIACHIGIAHDARGPTNTICQGDVSSLLALIEAVHIIQRGHADVMIVGGSSSRLSITPMLYRGITQLSRRNDSPAAACRPFDAARDGTVNGEGAAAFVVEREDHARGRGADILARVAGWGISFGTSAMPEHDHGRAIRRSIELALRSADLTATDIGHVNAHAAGSVEDDATEASAIRAVLGDVPVTAPKSFFGHLGASGGAVEMVASLLALAHGEIPVTLNYDQPDSRCPVQVVRTPGARAEPPGALLLSQSNTGQAVAVSLTA